MTADSSTAAALTSSADHSPVIPWAQVVRAGISIPPPSPDIPHPLTPPPEPTPETSDSSNNNNTCNAGNGNGVVRSVWSKPSSVSDVVEGSSSPVMGAVVWPALSESTRPGSKWVNDFSSKSASDGSNATVSQVPVVVQPLPKQAKPNNHSNPNRQRSNKRGGGSAGGGNAGGGSAGVASTGYVRPMAPAPPTPPPLPPPFPHYDMYVNLAPAVPVPPQPPFKGGNWAPRPVDPSLSRPPGRRSNFGTRPFNNGYGGRRENHAPIAPAAGDARIQHPMPPPPPPPFRGFARPPFLFPRAFRPYGPPMGYEMGAPYVYFPTLAQPPYRGGAPVVSSQGAPAPSLHDEILKQIEYYFSDDNLVKDNYLRSHMDEEGWVPIKLIADFRRVQALTTDIQILLSSLRDSSTVEIQDDKVRRRGDWSKWTNTPREVTGKFVEEASLQKTTSVGEPTNDEQVLANGDVSIDDLCS